MNEVLVGSREKYWPPRKLVKRLFWSAARSVALGGLFTWKLEDHWMRVERREMLLPNLGQGLQGASLVHVSDLHCSPIVLDKYLHQCVDKINSLKPDFVAITGDFITGPRHYARRVARVLEGLEPTVATVACLGNHDYGMFHPRGWGSIRKLSDHLTQHLAESDIFVMLNETRVFEKDGSLIQFVGLEDFWSGRFDPAQAFELARPSLPTIALCHNPDPARNLVEAGADWVLAGHTHGTQLSETRLSDAVLPSSNRHFCAGHYDLGQGKHLYVNRGLSYRRHRHMNCRPEITLFTLRGS